MNAPVESLGRAEGITGTAPQDEHGRGSWAEALAGTVPFLIIGLATILMAVFLAFDEVDNSCQLPYMLLLTLILVEGALVYMRCTRTWQRALALLVGTTLAVMVAAVGTVVYWRGPGNGWVNVRGTSIQGGYVVALVFAPALLGLRRCLVAS